MELLDRIRILQTKFPTLEIFEEDELFMGMKDRTMLDIGERYVVAYVHSEYNMIKIFGYEVLVIFHRDNFIMWPDELSWSKLRLGDLNNVNLPECIICYEIPARDFFCPTCNNRFCLKCVPGLKGKCPYCRASIEGISCIVAGFAN